MITTSLPTYKTIALTSILNYFTIPFSYFKKVLFGMIVGAVTVIVWKNADLGKVFFGESLYEIVPGFIFNLIVSVIVSLVTHKKNADIEKEFDESVRLLKTGA